MGARVAVVNWRDPDHSAAGGSERYAWELGRALRDAGAQVLFLTSRDTGQSSRERVEGIDVRRGGGTLGFYPWVAQRLLRERRRLDAVVDVENGIPQFAPLLLPRDVPVVLVVHHVHLDQFGSHFAAPVAAVGRALEGWAMPRAYRRARAVAVSDSTRAEMVARLGWRSPVAVVANGTDLPATVETDDVDTADRLLVLGRLVTHKRVDQVVAAVPALLEARPGLRLDIVGRGPAEASLRAQVARLGLDGSVTVHGYLPDDQLGHLARLARLHVCASDAEGWGLVVLEAAAYGVPTVARRVPGLRDSVVHGRTGWLVDEDARPVRDRIARGVLEALDELDDDARRREVSAACRDWSRSFTWDRMRADIAEVVRQELAGRIA